MIGRSIDGLNAPESILAAARRAAKRDGVSLNQFINTAIPRTGSARSRFSTRKRAESTRSRPSEWPRTPLDTWPVRVARCRELVLTTPNPFPREKSFMERRATTPNRRLGERGAALVGAAGRCRPSAQVLPGSRVSVQTLPVIPAGTAGIQTPWRAYRTGGSERLRPRSSSQRKPCGPTSPVGPRRHVAPRVPAGCPLAPRPVDD